MGASKHRHRGLTLRLTALTYQCHDLHRNTKIWAGLSCLPPPAVTQKAAPNDISTGKQESPLLLIEIPSVSRSFVRSSPSCAMQQDSLMKATTSAKEIAMCESQAGDEECITAEYHKSMQNCPQSLGFFLVILLFEKKIKEQVTHSIGYKPYGTQRNFVLK